jgi:MGT family glycosyltransferase
VSHIALFTMPMHGHVNPTLGLVRELVERGHRVTFPTTDEFTLAVSAAGADVLPYEGSMGPSRDLTVKAPADLTAEEFHTSILTLTEEGLAPLEASLARLEEDRPDLVLHDLTGFHTGRLLATAWGVPAVRLCTTVVYTDEWNPYLQFLSQYPAIDPEHPALVRERELLSAAFGRVGLAPSPPDAFKADTGTVAANIVFIPPRLQPGPEHFGEEWHFVGSCLDRRPRWEEAAVPETRPDVPLVLVSFGSFGYASQHELFAGCVREFAGEPFRAVLVVGNQVEPAELDPLPDNIEVHRFVPQLELLDHADVLVAHAGMGSVVEALWTRTPMVLLPQLTEQDLVAEQVQRLGLGRVLPRGHATGARVREAVSELLSDREVSGALATARADIDAAGGAGRAADVVESCLPPVPVRAGPQNAQGAQPTSGDR